jgi:uncharacterized membrane protein YedE/YeeE
MYVFAMTLLLGIGIFVVERFVERWLRWPEVWALVGVALGIAVAWILHYDVFRDWSLGSRAGWLGVTTSGIILGGVAEFWHVASRVVIGGMRRHDPTVDAEVHNLREAS